MKLMERVKKAKKNKKGFTLVELIVVIVILGILAAILVPSFVKYMDDAKEAQAKVEARSLYIAANYVYAKNKYDDTKAIEAKDITEQADFIVPKNATLKWAKLADKQEIIIEYKPVNGVAITIPEGGSLPSGANEFTGTGEKIE